jgi:hypothetical protein
VVVAIVRTGELLDTKGMTAFIIERGTKGLKAGKKENKLADMIYIVKNNETIINWGVSIEFCNENCMNIWLLERINEE